MLNKKVGLAAMFVGAVTGHLLAGTFTNYAVGDVLIGFRVSGNDNLVVDAGPVAMFTNLAANTTIQITNYTGSQLATVYTNNLTWSAFTWLDDSVTPVSAQWTLFLSKARTSLNTPTTAWVAQNASAQGNVGLNMQQVPIGALNEKSYSARSTTAAIVEQTGVTYVNGQSYVDAIYSQDTTPDFDTTLNGNPENTTSSTFTKSATPQRSDFWWVPPSDSGAAVKYLGYFQLNTNGYMSYTAYPSSGVAPTVTTAAAAALTNNAATLNGTVNANSQSTTTFFVYGLTTSYGSTNLVSGTLSGSSAVAVSTNLTGLSFGKTYHFRLGAYNATGTNYGNDLTFSTAAIPTPTLASFSRTGTNTVLAFPTYTTLTYKVRGTNLLSGPVSTWPVITSFAGDGTTHTVTNGTAGADMFYTLSAE